MKRITRRFKKKKGQERVPSTCFNQYRNELGRAWQDLGFEGAYLPGRIDANVKGAETEKSLGKIMKRLVWDL